MKIRNFYDSPLQEYLENLHSSLKSLREGKVADYIPELSHANPEWFGIALVTVDGYVYQVGDTQQDFTIQSISKAITYGMAMSDHGIKHLIEKVGVEPSGDAFNSISLHPDTGQPCNPMINAGAIAISSLIKDKNGVNRVQRVLDTMERYTGHPLTINDAVFMSENKTGHRNRAIAHLLRNYDVLDEEPDQALDLYFKQCSININCRHLAVMAATLANSGVNPITGVTTLASPCVDKVLSVMGSCGMYDYSGNWLFHVGMPAKSGVGGGIMAVLPGQFGLAVFSPPLDEKGNSVRGIRVCEVISSEFGLHLYHTARSTSASVLRVKYSVSQVRSRKERNSEQKALLNEHGNKVRGYELQGDLLFNSTASVILDMMQEVETSDYFILDFKHVARLDEASSKLFLEAVYKLHSHGKHIFFTSTRDQYNFVRYLEKNSDKEISSEVFRFKNKDLALEWCEDKLLLPFVELDTKGMIDIARHEICTGLSADEIESLRSICTPAIFKAGETVFQRGDIADCMYFILKGEIEVTLKIRHQHEKRLTTLSSGMSFGELAMINRNRRSADVRARTDTDCSAVKFTDIDASIRNKMVINLAGTLAEILDQNAEEITALS